jgi:hypothetical protein
MARYTDTRQAVTGYVLMLGALYRPYTANTISGRLTFFW